jgi:hypothetical protein
VHHPGGDRLWLHRKPETERSILCEAIPHHGMLSALLCPLWVLVVRKRSGEQIEEKSMPANAPSGTTDSIMNCSATAS